MIGIDVDDQKSLRAEQIICNCYIAHYIYCDNLNYFIFVTFLNYLHKTFHSLPGTDKKKITWFKSISRFFKVFLHTAGLRQSPQYGN